MAFLAAQHDQGAHRAQAQDQFAGRSAKRRRQPPRLPRWRRRNCWGGRSRNTSRWRCCCSISIISSKSTTSSATPSATPCCKALPRTATQTLGADILFARIGGEEFAVLPAGRRPRRGLCDRRSGAAQFRRRGGALRQRQLSPSVSVGVTLGCDPGVTVTELLSIVDRALYRAKEWAAIASSWKLRLKPERIPRRRRSCRSSGQIARRARRNPPAGAGVSHRKGRARPSCCKPCNKDLAIFKSFFQQTCAIADTFGKA